MRMLICLHVLYLLVVPLISCVPQRNSVKPSSSFVFPDEELAELPSHSVVRTERNVSSWKPNQNKKLVEKNPIVVKPVAEVDEQDNNNKDGEMEMIKFTEESLCPDEDTYCEDPLEYPNELVQNIIKRMKMKEDNEVGSTSNIFDAPKIQERRNWEEKKNKKKTFPFILSRPNQAARPVISSNIYEDDTVEEVNAFDKESSEDVLFVDSSSDEQEYDDDTSASQTTQSTSGGSLNSGIASVTTVRSTSNQKTIIKTSVSNRVSLGTRPRSTVASNSFRRRARPTTTSTKATTINTTVPLALATTVRTDIPTTTSTTTTTTLSTTTTTKNTVFRISTDEVDSSLPSLSDEELQQELTEHETPLCRSRTSYIFPKRAKNNENLYKFIINSPETSYVQTVRIEKCHQDGAQCSLIGGSSFQDFGVETVCRQKFTLRKLLAINSNGEEEVDYFQFPSCCVCHQVVRSPFSPSYHFS